MPDCGAAADGVVGGRAADGEHTGLGLQDAGAALLVDAVFLLDAAALGRVLLSPADTRYSVE